MDGLPISCHTTSSETWPSANLPRGSKLGIGPDMPSAFERKYIGMNIRILWQFFRGHDVLVQLVNSLVELNPQLETQVK
jgi:hypothetical protein